MKRLLLLLGLFGCGEAPTTDAAVVEPHSIYATTYPLAWMTERLVGDALPVACPLPADVDPAFWDPPRDVVAAYRQAPLVVANGAEYSRWLTRASLPESRLVRTADGFAQDFLHFEAVTHSHGPGGDHTHAGVDGHTWIDPVQAQEQARAIARALTVHFESLTGEVERNLAALEADLKLLDEAWRTLAVELAEVNLICSHRAYEYLWRRYGLSATNLELDPDALFAAGARAQLGAALRDDRPNLMIWEAPPRSATRSALLNEFGVTSVTVSLVAVLPQKAHAAGEDYLTIQLAQIERLWAALE